MICTDYDQWLKDQDRTIWIVELKHEIGQGDCTVYQDDGRPGIDEPNAWIRLRNCLKQDDEFCIERLAVQFRDHREYLPIDKHPYCGVNRTGGVYFAKGVVADMFNPHPSNYYVLGVVEEDRVHKYWYRIPEVILYDQTWDPIPSPDDPRLIINHG